MAGTFSRGALNRGLAVLTFINLFNYMDRFVISALAESLRTSELRLSDTQLGSLMTGFVIVYMLTSPIFGALGDRSSRTRLVGFGVAIWSLATALSGFARGFASLFMARAAVGIGEAAYGSITPGLLADYYPKRLRGRVFAIFFAAIPIGSALGYALGGIVDKHFGWRSAFFVAGLPGLLLAALCFFLPDPPRGSQDPDEAVSAPPPGGMLGGYAALLKNRPYLLTVLGYAAYTFAVGGLAFWMPSFLERIRGISREEATVTFGIIVVITGFVGTFAGGWLGDFFLRYSQQSYLWVSGIATLLAFPVSILALSTPSLTVLYPAMVIAQILLFISTGPVNSAIVNLVPPTTRATAVALSILCIHLFGDVPSPPLIGMISDGSSLGVAIMVVPAAVLASGILWVLAARSAALRRHIQEPIS